MVKHSHGSTISSISILCQEQSNFHPSGIFYGDNPLTHSFSILMFHLILITTITRIFRFLLKPFKQPIIISQILGGVIVGPSFLGRSKWYHRHVKPEAAQFLMNNLGIMGFMFFVFVYGVKMDPSLLKKSGKMHVSIALTSITIPTLLVYIVALSLRKQMDKELSAISSIGVIAGYLGITAFPVLYHVLKELNLLNSDVGRFALSTALIGDSIGMGSILAFEAERQGQTRTENAFWFMLSAIALATLLLCCVRPAMIWINNKTPEGQPVDQSFIVAILLGIFVMGFITDMFGIAIVNGPLWLGLAVPDGPGLGATLVHRSKTFMNEFLMPFSFILVGQYVDFFALGGSEWKSLKPLFFMVLTGYLAKFFVTWMVAMYWRMPFRDGLTFSLIMSLRGQVELILFVHLMDKKVINVPGFTLLVLMTMVLTATFTPLVSIIYDPTRPYILNQRRNIQHNPQGVELRIILCIFDTENTNGLLHLLDVTNPTSTTSISVSCLRLIQLAGRATPLFIDHAKQEVPPIYQWTHTINVLGSFQHIRREFMKIQFFTAVAPKQSMFQNICELALEQEASLIILPFMNRGFYDHGTRRTANSQVLNHAPCSIAILVDKGNLHITTVGNSTQQPRNRFAVLFLGGADAREALVYADRMVASEDVSLTVIRFLSYNNVGDNEREKKLDDGIVTWFWVKNEMNSRVVYREVVVRNGEETIGAIQDMNDGDYDLLIVGRKHGINPAILTGLSEWSESDELGLIGDYVSSRDFDGSASVLVVQQQVLRG
ncbi:cation/H(+) antiporter 24 [Trifolium pratense]|uniref:cation/H(+) antiporter 24 n=1 Tax=Trifolium pratense TaxID=57577 RepID=UPI001E690D36|nr:cation/H(+) antiporter 24 [Trifolium pratense]